jgi:hypothetical protein
VIGFPEPGVKSDKVTIRGAKKDIDQCYKHLAQLNKELLESNFKSEVPIYKQFHKFIIGKEGATIRKVSVCLHLLVYSYLHSFLVMIRFVMKQTLKLTCQPKDQNQM